MERDKQLFELLEKEQVRQQSGIELIASENFVSPQVLEAVGSVATNKYAEGLPGRRYYGGCEIIDQIEQLAIDRAKTLYNAEWVNVQPHSGASANAAVMLAVLKPGDTILGFDLSHGGHLTHGSKVNYSGKLYRPVFYGVRPETGYVDYEQVAEVAEKEKPRMIICGASAYPREWEYDRLRQIADSVGALLLADMAHPAGIIAKGRLKSPIPHCHIVTTTTHKTLRGPRGGMILMGKDFENPWGIATKKGKVRSMSSLLDSAVFPGMQGGPLEHSIAGKAVAFGEALTDSFDAYIKQVQLNAKAMGKALLQKGYGLSTDGTDNHLLLIDLRNKGITGKAAEAALGNVSITVNKNMVPFDDKSPFETSGIRIGSSAITTRGLKEEHMVQIIDWIDQAIMSPNDLALHQSLKSEIQNFMSEFPLFN